MTLLTNHSSSSLITGRLREVDLIGCILASKIHSHLNACIARGYCLCVYRQFLCLILHMIKIHCYGMRHILSSSKYSAKDDDVYHKVKLILSEGKNSRQRPACRIDNHYCYGEHGC